MVKFARSGQIIRNLAAMPLASAHPLPSFFAIPDIMILTKYAHAANAVMICLTCCYVSTTLAAPAPWYLWQSKRNAQKICTQIPPGQGWDVISGPFRDAQCQYPLRGN